MHRGPGGIEPQLILEAMKRGKDFDAAVTEIEQSHYFVCEQWWKDLNRDVMTKQVVAKPKPDPLK